MSGLTRRAVADTAWKASLGTVLADIGSSTLTRRVDGSVWLEIGGTCRPPVSRADLQALLDAYPEDTP